MTLEAEAKLKELWENRLELSADVIGKRFGVSKNVVIGIARRRGWRPRTDASSLTEEQRAAANRRRQSQLEGKTPWAVRRWLTMCGFDLNQHLTADDLAALPMLTVDEENEYPFERTTLGRLAAIHAKMDAVLESCGVKPCPSRST